MLKRKKLSEINHKGKRIKKGEICLKKKKMRESIFRNWSTGLNSRVFANGLGDWGSISDRVIQDSKNGT